MIFLIFFAYISIFVILPSNLSISASSYQLIPSVTNKCKEKEKAMIAYFETNFIFSFLFKYIMILFLKKHYTIKTDIIRYYTLPNCITVKAYNQMSEYLLV